MAGVVFVGEAKVDKPGQQIAEDAALDVRGRLELLADVCDAVAHAHERGVVHRDLKPSNILVDEGGRPRVLDFGIARVLDPDVTSATLQTAPGQVIGTLQYMSPEQAGGRSDPITPRSDVFALGVLAYQLLTGRLPRDLDDRPFPDALRRVAEGETALLGRADRALRGDLETIVAKATSAEPGRRYADAGELAADLRRHLADEPIHARPVSTLYVATRLVRRHRALSAALAAAPPHGIAVGDLARRHDDEVPGLFLNLPIRSS